MYLQGFEGSDIDFYSIYNVELRQKSIHSIINI